MALSLLVFTGVVLRAEVAGLVIVFALQSLFEGSISFFSLVKIGLISCLVSLGQFSPDVQLSTFDTFSKP
jgi:hypothetical protein